ncbi:lariat debranching enzyme, C-terminal domain-containing protein [Zychaea mexicana]|uniref:lariat debranching enzyme, C-terminal domain-containing protein n=1 Tax=Zychaea mexicana TaxID=64656 RepID=UPI0022FE036E|nr:lariat debranching enzyme, C-terminal domain-containing protein [Zychaea mexicana]KAI9491745.1 lariat debranching enzyme, C-terminal domain-containing protein [Zychaea mexicana]
MPSISASLLSRIKLSSSSALRTTMKIAVEGCCHGHLDEIYGSLKLLEQRKKCKIDLLLICGDFQAVRNPGDMRCMSVPPQYQKLGSFWKYYSGKAKAPYLTIFIGGNHEASNHLWELYHGGWVCENIYYLGHAGVVNYKGLRIGGVSGIFKQHDYTTGHYERYPYNPSDLRSVYHVREYDVRKLLQIRKPMDVFLSHDWPQSIEHCGDLDQLLRKKRFLENDIRSSSLGSRPNKDLLLKLKPDYWFAAHLHVHYPAVVDHAKSEKELKPGDGNASEGVTKFLSLDKCLPRRQFLQVVDVPTPEPETSDSLKYDLEWLAITKALHPYLSLNREATPLPTDEEMQSMIEQELMFLGMQEDMDELDLTIPKNFSATCDVFSKTCKCLSY